MHILVFAPTQWLFSDATTVFAISDMTGFAVLQSNIHVAWIERQASSMRNDLRYTPSSCFQTFVMPTLKSDSTASSASLFYEFRDQVQAARGVSLRKLYDAINNKNDRSEDVVKLREMQIDMDAAVASLYGWDAGFLNHGFRKTTHGDRFDISETARIEVLRRLSELNRQRHEDEVARGMHAEATRRSSSRAPRGRRTTRTTPVQSSFDFETASFATDDQTPTAAIIGFLTTHDGWHAKAEILAATGITDDHWNTAIAALIANYRVERQGERRGARYRAIQNGGEVE